MQGGGYTSHVSAKSIAVVAFFLGFAYLLYMYTTPHLTDFVANTSSETEASLARAQIAARKASGEQGIIQVSGCLQEPEEWEVGHYPKIPGTIFVSVASYRDDECKDTVYDMFAKAKNKDNVFAGVVQQNKEGEEDCFDKCAECAQRKQAGHIRVINMSHEDAKGPTYARYLCSKLWRGEEWYLQIDSHTRFEENWDETLLEQLRLTNDPKAAIGAYPPTQDQMEEMKRNNFTTMITMCPNKFDATGLPQISARVVPTKGRRAPLPTAFLSAGLMCFPGEALYKVPFDPYLSWVFFSEELVFSARLYTHGYNIYAPAKAFCVHHYGREDKPKFWQDHAKSEPCKRKALQRSKYLLGFIKKSQVHPDYFLDIEKYGMGTDRTLADYFQHAGINPVSKTVTGRCPEP